MVRIKRRRDKILLLQEEIFLKILTQIENKGLSLDDAFKDFDTDKNGNIDFQELNESFKKYNIKVTKNEVKAIFAILDYDDNGYISLEEFKEKLKRLRDEIRQREEERRKEEERKRKELEDKKKEEDRLKGKDLIQKFY